jgi:hypothetical protein
MEASMAQHTQVPTPSNSTHASNLYDRGFIGHSGGMLRAAERHKVLAAAEVAGIK